MSALFFSEAASPAPVGSGIFSVLALLAVSIAVLLLLRHFLPLRTTPAYLTLPVFLALALPASIVLLVPIDLVSSSEAEDSYRGIWLPDRVILVSWRIAYWLTFALTWLVFAFSLPWSTFGANDCSYYPQAYTSSTGRIY